MGSYDTEIRVATKVDTSQMQKLQIQIDKTVDKVEALQKEYDELCSKKIPTQGYKKLQEELSVAQKEMEKLKAQDSKLSALDVKIGKLTQSSTEYAAKMKEVAEQRIPTQEYTEVQRQIENTEKKINDLMAKQEKMLATGGSRKSSVYKKMAYDLEELRNSLPYLKGELQDLIDKGKEFTLGTDTEKYQNLSAKYEAVNQELEKQKGLHSEIAQKQAEAVQKAIELKSQMNQLVKDGKAFTIGADRGEISDKAKELARAKAELRMLVTKQEELGVKSTKVSDGLKRIGNAAKKAFGGVGSEIKKSSRLMSTFFSRLKGITLSLLIFNWISKGFNSMIAGMKKGFENFMRYSNSYIQNVQNMKNALGTLGNQFVSAFAPIVQVVIPWLTRLINFISTAMTYVAQFIAILGGKSTFTCAKQVQDSYNKSLGNTAKAADKARGALAKFDDLDVLEKKQEDTGAGGGDGTAGNMFEEVPVDGRFKDWLDGILERLKPILDYLKKLKDIFMEGFWDGLGDWEYRLEIIKNALASIKESLIDIFTDHEVIEAADKWAQSVAYMLGSLAGSFVSIGLTIAADLLGGIATYLEENKERIKGYLVSMFDVWTEINYMLADFFQSFAYVFEAFASEGGIQLTANLIGIFADAFMGITELASKLVEDILNIFIQPFVDNKEELRTALEGFLGVLADVTGTIKQGIDDTFDKLNEVYDSHFKPFFDSVAQGLSDIASKFLDFWNGKVQPILSQWAEDFSALWTDHIQPLLDNVAEFLGKIADLLRVLWENILQPLIEWVIDNVLPMLLPIFETMWNVLTDLIGYIADMASNIIDILGGVVDFLTGIFSGNWEKAFNGIAEISEGFIGYLRNTIEGGITIISEYVSGILQNIQLFFSDTWTSIYETTLEVWTSIQEWFTEFWTIFTETLFEIWENIILFFTEAWENITLIFQTFIDFINDTVIPIWQEAWSTAGNLFQIFRDLIDLLIKAIKELFTGFMKSIKLLVDGDWKGAWENAKKVFDIFKEKVDSIIGTIRGILESFFNWVSEMISGVLEAIGNIGSAIAGIFSGGIGGSTGGGGGAMFSMTRVAAYDLGDIPHLASGAVIRGGNPYMAILGDQPKGQTNVETPLDTIKQAVREEMSGMNFGTGSLNADLTLDGETVGRLLLPYIIDEMIRQGYDVDILGVT